VRVSAQEQRCACLPPAPPRGTHGAAAVIFSLSRQRHPPAGHESSAVHANANVDVHTTETIGRNAQTPTHSTTPDTVTATPIPRQPGAPSPRAMPAQPDASTATPHLRREHATPISFYHAFDVRHAMSAPTTYAAAQHGAARRLPRRATMTPAPLAPITPLNITSTKIDIIAYIE